jgi:hypothetical protein
LNRSLKGSADGLAGPSEFNSVGGNVAEAFEIAAAIMEHPATKKKQSLTVNAYRPLLCRFLLLI